MKALINILSRLLLLLILATACAPDLDTEVPLMGKDEVLLTVNMQVPGLKVSTRAGEALTDIKALCFNESGGLEKIETATEVTASTFKIYVPKETRKIHFLANLPENYSLGGVTKESDLTELTTTDKSSLSYWGMATFDGTNKSIPQVNFYRNMAMITIAPGEDAVFDQNQLSIAGVVNGYNTGKLVPNRGVDQNVSFDFNLSNGYDYYSLPTTYTLTDDAEDKQYGATAYVFEHPNEPNTLLDALHVICKIGNNYYKVALAYEDQQGEYHNYSIIRNHKYVIYVSDVCDVPQERYSSNYSDVLNYEPINMEVVDVALRAITQTSQLYFDGTSTKEMMVEVTIPPGVTGLNITAKDYSSVKVGDTSLQGNNGVYTYSCASSETEQMVSFTFTLNTNVSYNDNQTSQITFSDAAQGSLVEEYSISITLKKTPEVQLTIQQQPLTNSTLYYSETSREEFTMDVNVPAGVEQLQITAEDFDVSWATGNGVGTGTTYTISDTQNSKTVRLMFTLKEGVSSTDSPSAITITGSGDYVIVSEPLTTNITLEESAAPAEGSINWQGAVMMDYENQHMTKIPIFYDDLKDLLPDSKIQVEYSGNGGWIGIYYPYALDGAENQWDNVSNDENELNDNELVLTETILNNIKDHPDAGAYNHQNVGLIIQGADDRLLTKITIVPAKERIEANITNGATLYYDSDDSQVVTVNVTVPAGVTTLNIAAADFSAVSADGGYTVSGDATNGYNVSLVEEGEKTINFTFTLDKTKYTQQTENTSTAITFSDASGNATAADVNVNLIKTPVVTFTTSAESISLSEYLDVSMNLTGTFNGNVSLTITALDFTVTANGQTLTQDEDGVCTYNGTLTTLRFTPTSVGEKTIAITGSGENVKVEDANISVTVNAAITATATPSTIYYDGDDKSVIVNVTIPKGVSELSISAPNFKYGEETGGSYTYTRTDDFTTETTVELIFTLNDNVTEDSSITFSDASENANVSGATVNINVEATPAQGEEIVIYEADEKNPAISINGKYVLFNREGTGNFENFETYFTPKAKLYVEFNCNPQQYQNAPSLSIETTWSKIFATFTYNGEESAVLSYIFGNDDFGGSDGSPTITYAGLQLTGNFVSITKIYIITAPPTE